MSVAVALLVIALSTEVSRLFSVAVRESSTNLRMRKSLLGDDIQYQNK